MTTFTALNGERSPQTAEAINGTTDSDRVGSQPVNPESRINEVINSQKDREGREGQLPRTSTNHERLPFPGAATFADAEGSHKRKRSISDSPRRNRLPSPPSRSERTEGLERGERAEHGSHRPQPESQHAQISPQKEAYRGGEGDEGREGDEPWRSQQTREGRTSSYDGPYSAGPVSAQSDDQPSGLLRRATSQGESGDYADYGNQSPDGDDRAMYSGDYTPEQRRDGVIQLDPKKRKRNFSNRTKTGCLTCRRRKKKCDEQKPECELAMQNNCAFFFFFFRLLLFFPDALVYTPGHICGRIGPDLAANQRCRSQLCKGELCVCWIPSAEGKLAQAREQANTGQHRIEGSQLCAPRSLWDAPTAVA